MLGIIIPTYDSLDTLKVLIKNIFDYTTGDYRLYVIEDGQKQETIDWLKEQKINTIFHETNKGVAPSWNDGLRTALADGCDYFAFFNDDIELPPNWWEDCRKEFNDKIHVVVLDAPCPFAFTGWFFILDKYCVQKVGFFDEQFAPYYSEDEDYYFRIRLKRVGKVDLKLNVFHHGSHTINKIRNADPVEFARVAGENSDKLSKKFPFIRRR